MQDKLRALEDRYEALNEEMGRPEVSSDYQRIQTLAKERATLEKVVGLYRALRKNEEDITEAKVLALGNDGDLSELAKEELADLEPEHARLEAELRAALLPPDPRDERDVIVEVRAGTGGEEAS